MRTLPAWKALLKHYERTKNLHLRQLFAEDPERGENLAVEGAGIYLDYSKNRITDETIRLLVQLAEECRLRERIEAMFRGERINVSEQRAVLHVALRAPKGERIVHDGLPFGMQQGVQLRPLQSRFEMEGAAAAGRRAARTTVPSRSHREWSSSAAWLCSRSRVASQTPEAR